MSQWGYSDLLKDSLQEVASVPEVCVQGNDTQTVLILD